jgi:hypothetical protein
MAHFAHVSIEFPFDIRAAIVASDSTKRAAKSLRVVIRKQSESHVGGQAPAAGTGSGSENPQGLRAATAMGRTWWRCRAVELRRVVVGFGAYCRSAFCANAVVLVSARKNEQELCPRRRRAAAPRAEQAGGLKLGEAFGPGHLVGILHTPREQSERWGRLLVA